MIGARKPEKASTIIHIESVVTFPRIVNRIRIEDHPKIDAHFVFQEGCAATNIQRFPFEVNPSKKYRQSKR